MSPTQIKLAFKKQREINRRLREELRAQAMLCNALASVRFDKNKQEPAVIRRIREAHSLLESITSGSPVTKPYPVRSEAA